MGSGMDSTVPASWPFEARLQLQALLKRADETLTDELAVSWNGEVHEWRSERSGQPIQTMSVTKSAVGLVIGRLVTLGKLRSIEEPVHTFFPEWRQGRKASITIRMLMEHTSGLQNVPLTTVEIQPSSDYVQLALAAELSTDPGAVYAYNNKAVNLLAGVVEQADGRKLDVFAREELLRPLGIADSEWLRDDAGNPHAMSGLALHAADLTRLGSLLLERGRWNGEQLIAEDWFAAMDNPSDAERESALMWWHVHDAQVTVADEHVEALRQAGAEPLMIEFFENKVGVHPTPMKLFVALRKELGFWQDRLPAGVQPFNMVVGGKLAYRAEGDLGQHVYVFRDSGLVVARLIQESTIEAVVPDFGRPPESVEEHLERIGSFMFTDFEELAVELSRALE